MDLRVEIIPPSNIIEDYPPTLNVEEIPAYLSQKKMANIHYDKPLDNKIILTSDTIVLLDGTPLGKPQDEMQARQMLSDLSGKQHSVISACCLKSTNGIQTISDKTLVWFAPLAEKEINYYVLRYQPFDKAGSYGIQEWIGLIGVERIEGSFYNVMGLPCHKLHRAIRNLI